jgi:2-hydroxychromene-2-carboxylate isomerase
MRTVAFYFDLSCPWSYLALVRLRDATERNAARIEFKPVCVDDLLATENPALQETRLSAIPAHAAWQLKDLQDWASLWGLQLVLPERWPFRADQAAAAMVAADRAGHGMEFALAVFRAVFAAGADISQQDTLLACAAVAKMDAVEFAAQLQTPVNLDAVRANTLELIRRGGFGTPSMFVDGELFFGNDRVPLVEWTLGPIGDAEFVMPGQHSKI